MCQCQKRRNECFHVCMQLVLNPCTHHKFRKWWLLICTARNSLVVTTCNVESLSISKQPSQQFFCLKICTHFAQTMQHSYLSVLRAEKGFCLRLLELHAREHNPSFDLYGPYYIHIIWPMCYLNFTYLSIESDLTWSSLVSPALVCPIDLSIFTNIHTFTPTYLSLHPSEFLSII